MLVKFGASAKGMTMTVELRSEQDVDDLITDIRRAARDSRSTGGQYGCMRKTGKHKVFFDIYLKARMK